MRGGGGGGALFVGCGTLFAGCRALIAWVQRVECGVRDMIRRMRG